MTDERNRTRRTFLKTAGVLAAGAAAGCELQTRLPANAPASGTADRDTGFDRPLLDAVAEIVLPAELGTKGRTAAVSAFIEWVDGYEPVAEEMHGYGYADIRYLPPDPAPAWRAQLAGLDLLARKSLQRPFARLEPGPRLALLQAAIAGERGDRLPAPLAAQHVATALLAHWAASPDARDLALGARVQAGTCRVLGDANARPLPLTGLRA
ncbi:MAG: gluconate 2-dehydrogenase subunit 3 family protein [Gemmatimonadaceae bacterium]|nr:gluconate 2-dehydrogenase subunit 3 family protein [Gemmatimonadaceae bacterium]